MFKFIKKNVQIYKKKYGKKIKEPKIKIVINLDYYEPVIRIIIILSKIIVK